MDGHPNPKTKTYKGELYSETRYFVIKWLEKVLPSVTGDILIVSAGNWKVPKTLLTNAKAIKTLDQKIYGNTKNSVDIIGDVHNLPKDWDNKWDCIINNQAIECYENPFVAVSEMYRVLKPGGTLFLDSPFNYRFFGQGSWTDKEQNKKDVKDYWRITKQGLLLLTKQFSKVSVEGFGGTGEHDRFVYCLEAIK